MKYKINLFKIKNKEYVSGWQEKYNTLFVDGFAQATVKYPDIIGNNISEYYSFIDKTNYVEVYYSKKAQEKVDREHGRYFLKKVRIKKLINNYRKIIIEHNRLLKKIKSLNLSNSTDEELLSIFNNFFDFFILMLAHYRSSRHEAEIEPTKIIKKILAKYYYPSEIDGIFGVIAESPIPTIIEKERSSWLKLVAINKIYDTDYEKHIHQFASFFINLWSIKDIISMLQARSRTDKKNLKTLTQEMKEKEKYLKKLPQLQTDVYKKCRNNKDLIIYSRMLQDFGRYRFEVKNLWAGAEIIFLPLFQEIVKRFGITVYDLYNYYTIDEVKRFLTKGGRLSGDELKKRKDCIAILVNNNNYNLLTGNQARRLMNIPRSSFKQVDKVYGTIAYKGVVRGYVKQVYPDTMGKTVFKKGEILVTTATQPSMVPIMTKAAAYVTDFGGITSHSAIVARELKVPCVIGTKIGSRMFKDGDYIEVNADEGYVIRLKKHKKAVYRR